MRHIDRILFGALIMMMTSILHGQAVRADKDDKEASRIGYGVNLGNIRFYNSTFEFGLAPNIAYRIAEPLSVGFMLKTDYYFAKYRDFSTSRSYKFSAFDFGPTVFARYKPLWSWDAATPFLQGLFLQAEYERAFLKREAVDPNTGSIIVVGDKVQKETLQQNYLYLGLGASSGYPFSTFVSIHYNVLDEFESVRNPFSYRIGFTYNY